MANQDDYDMATTEYINHRYNPPSTPQYPGPIEPVVVTPPQYVGSGTTPSAPTTTMWSWMIGLGVLALVLAGRK